MSALYKFFVTRIVAWIAKLPAEDWARIVKWVGDLDLTGTPGDGSGPGKAALLRQRIANMWKNLDAGTITWLIEMALRLVRKTA